MKRLLVLTIGTSNRSWETFSRLLELNGVDALIDVRSRPYSRHRHFCQPEMRARATHLGLPYLHLPELGGLARRSAAISSGGTIR